MRGEKVRLIGVIGAMQVEVQPLILEMRSVTKRTVSGRVFHRGRLCGRDVVVVRGGVGKVNAAMSAEAMILEYRPELIVNVGVAGALTGALEIGDIAVARDLVQYDVDSTALGDPPGFVSTVERVEFPCAPWAVEGIVRALACLDGMKARVVRIASGDRFNDDAQTAKMIVDTFHADACEMEACPIAQVCFVNGIDCAVIRAISDSTAGSHSREYTLCRDVAAGAAARALMAFLESIGGK